MSHKHIAKDCFCMWCISDYKHAVWKLSDYTKLWSYEKEETKK